MELSLIHSKLQSWNKGRRTCGAMASSSFNVDLSRFLASGLSEKDKEKSRMTVVSHFFDPVLLQKLMTGTDDDITLEARGGSMRAHKRVLAESLKSPNFAFRINYATTIAVDMKEMSIITLQLFVLLIYIACEKRMNPAMLELREAVDRQFRQLYEAAIKYEAIERLSVLFADALPRNLSAENCWDFYRMSTSHVSMRDISHEYILHNFNKVITSNRAVVEMDQNPELVQSFMIVVAACSSACDNSSADHDIVDQSALGIQQYL